MKNESAVNYFTELLRNFNELENLLTLCQTSFALAKLQITANQNELPKIKVNNQDLSFVPALGQISVQFSEGWVSLSEYCKETHTKESEMSEKFNSGALGSVSVKDGQNYIYYPDKGVLPNLAIGKKRFRVTAKHSLKGEIDIDDDDPDASEKLLSIVQTLGETESVVNKVSPLLYATVFVTRWNFFEAYLRELVRDLYRNFPESLAHGKRGQTSISYTEVLALSENFSSIDRIREHLVEFEIAKAEGQESIHGLINHLKESFALKPDPYSATFVFKSKKLTSSYNKLLEIKEVRNCIVHEGSDSIKLLAKFPDVPHQDGKIQITAHYDSEIHLALLATAASLNKASEKKKREKLSTES